MIQQRETGAYKSDELADFAETGDLVDLSKHNPYTWRAVLIDVIASRSIGALLQLGAYLIYPLLGFLKQDIPGLRVADMLYNPVGHMVRHSIYEGAIDLQFKNTSQYPVRIVTNFDGSNISVALMGVKTVNVESQNGGRWNYTAPQPMTLSGDTCTPSTGAQGFTTSDTRIIRDLSGNELSRETTTTVYDPSPIVTCK